MLKNIHFKKYFLQQSPIPLIHPVIEILLETCSSQCDYNPQNIELFTVGFRFLIALLCLPQSHPLGSGFKKFYIPGETMEMEKMRARSVADYGLLSLLGYLDSKQLNEELK